MGSLSAGPRPVVARLGAPVVGVLLLIIALAWLATIATSPDLMQLLMRQVEGTDPVGTLSFLALVGVMMGAMMLPSALPMLHAYRGLATLDSTPYEGWVRTVLFSGSYLVLWALFTGGALVLLVVLGLMGTLSGWTLFIPGLILLGAGIYQFSSWKTICLEQCRSPVGFVMTHWKGGRSGAARMGWAHGLYCLGCCWALMLVVFVTGAMSLLWMAGFSGLVLVEKVWGRGEAFARGLGAAAALGGVGLTAWILLGSLPP